MKVAIISTHPIQYHAPLFSHLSKNSNYSLKVFYTLGNQGEKQFDKDFGIERSWNIDLLSGYVYEFLENTSTNASLDLYFGIQNPRLIKKVEAYSPDLILVFGWRHHSHLHLLRYFKGKVPVLFRGDSTTLDDSERNPIFNKLRYLFLTWVYRHVDFVLSPGSASDQYFQKAGIRKSSIIRVPHAIDNERFSFFSITDEKQLHDLKQRLYISGQDFVFLFAGKFIEKKNPLLLIKAFAILASNKTSIRLVLVGNGVLEAKILEQIASLPISISKRIHVIPFQDQNQMKVIYRLANIFILPSKGPGETWGLSVNESIASGTPVIVSDKCGVSYDLVRDSFNGFVFRALSIHSLLSKMECCLKSETILHLKKNVKISLQDFSFDSFSNAIDSVLYEKLKN